MRNKTAPTEHLERNLCFYYSNFFPGNFIFTDTGNLYLIEIDQAGFPPSSFVSYALTESCWAPGLWTKDTGILRLPEHNLDAMKNIAYWFTISSSWLGELGRVFPFLSNVLGG